MCRDFVDQLFISIAEDQVVQTAVLSTVVNSPVSAIVREMVHSEEHLSE
jgi:hypothetical protein